MGVNVSLYDYGFVGNECWGIIEFNDLLPIGSSITLLLIYYVSRYLCHLWGALLMLTILIHMIDEAGLSLLLLSHGQI